MNTSLFMAAIAICLGGVMVMELVPANIVPGSSAPKVAAGLGAPPTLLHPGAAGMVNAGHQMVNATLLARPLFSPSRRPFVPARTVSADPQLPRLSGIMIMKAGRFAIFSPAAGEPIIIAQAGHLGAFTIQAITADSVTVTGPDGTKVMNTDFGDGKASPATTPDVASLADGITLPGGLILQQPETNNLPNAATWPGPPDLFGLSAAGKIRRRHDD